MTESQEPGLDKKIRSSYNHRRLKTFSKRKVSSAISLLPHLGERSWQPTISKRKNASSR